MRAPLFGQEEGPEWRASVEAADTGDQRFRDNLETLCEALTVAPHQHSRPLQPEVPELRYATTRDTAAGYRLVLFFRFDEQRATCVLGWVAREPL